MFGAMASRAGVVRKSVMGFVGGVGEGRGDGVLVILCGMSGFGCKSRFCWQIF